MKPRSSFIVLVTALVVLSFAPAYGAIIAAWDFSNVSFNNPIDGGGATALPTTADANIVAPVLSRGAAFSTGGIGFNLGRGAFSTSIGAGSADLAAALTAGAYAQFTISPQSGYEVSIASLDVATFVQNDHGANYSFEVLFSTDSFATHTSVGVINPVSAGWSGAVTNFDLSGFAALQNVTSDIVFRMAHYGSAGAWEDRGLGQIAGANDDILVSGVVTPIPEPAVTALLTGLVLAGLMLRRRF